MLPVIRSILLGKAIAARLERQRWSQRTGPGKRSTFGRYGRVHGYSGAEFRALRRFRGVGRPPRTELV